jgi:predicted glycoside hydrolase/deacetylase ChbG (UPF0249 family)
MSKKLIINADDFGLHRDVNLGIIEAYRHGMVCSTSLMVNGPAVDHAVHLAAENPGLEIGLHLNLSAYQCVAQPSKLNSLVDPTGNFVLQKYHAYEALLHLQKMICSQPKVLKQIAFEFSAQVEKFLDLGLKIGHVNVHQYLSLIHPKITEIYCDLIRQLEVPGRGLCFPMLDFLPLSSEEHAEIFRQLGSPGLHTTDHSISNLADAQDQKPLFADYSAQILKKLGQLAGSPTVRVVELITHPGIISETVLNLDNYAWARELEWRLVTDLEIKKTLKTMGYASGGYQNAY